jgi:flagellar biosynthesis protein FlhF
MKVKKFHGATAREALKRVRETLGEDAVILSNRNVAGRIEVLAIADEDMASIVAPANIAAPAAQADTIEVRSLLRAAGGQGQQSVQKNERRVHHALPIANAAPQAVTAAPTAALSEEIKSMRTVLENQISNLAAAQTHPEAAPANIELVAEMKAMRTAFEQQVNELARASEAQKALSERGLAAENARLVAEIGSLRSLVERELAGLAWNENARRQPVRAELLRRCLQAGFSIELARRIADGAPSELNERDMHKWLAATLEQSLPIAAAEEIVERGGVYALVGPTGVGKTTTVAKLAARCAVKYGAKSLALITADTYRIGAHDQLRTYGKILGVPVNTVHDASALADLLSSYSDKHLVLIDTVGLAQRDERVNEQIEALVANNVQRLLVLNASVQPETIEDVIDVYQGNGLAGCVLSKVDEAVKLGGALDALIRHNLKLHYVANGQRVPEDLHAPNTQYLVHRSLRAHTPAALAMNDDEIVQAARI